MAAHVRYGEPVKTKAFAPVLVPTDELAMLRAIDADPETLPAGATPRVAAHRNERVRWVKASAETAKGTVYQRKDGKPGINPWLKVEREAADRMRRIEEAIRRDQDGAVPERPADQPAGGLAVHRTQAQRVLGLPTRTFARLEAEGVIVPKRRGKPGVPSVYDLAVIVPAYVEYVRGTSGKAAGDREARARRDRSQADLNELRLMQARKELLPRDQVIRDDLAFIAAAMAKLGALPRRMVQAGIIPIEQQSAVADLIREAREEMARWKSRTDLLAAAKGAA